MQILGLRFFQRHLSKGKIIVSNISDKKQIALSIKHSIVIRHIIWYCHCIKSVIPIITCKCQLNFINFLFNDKKTQTRCVQAKVCPKTLWTLHFSLTSLHYWHLIYYNIKYTIEQLKRYTSLHTTFLFSGAVIIQEAVVL